MLRPGEYIPLERAIVSLKRDHPEVLKAIAKGINSVDPHAEFNRETIIGSRYGGRIPGFAITYGQLGAYLNTAVTRLVSVLIETEVGVIESSHVSVNREWLLNQREHAARQPEVVREIELRSYASHGTTVTPIIQPLEDQDPKAARAELRKLNIRIERSFVIRPDDERDAEIERLRIELEASTAREKAVAAKNDASDKYSPARTTSYAKSDPARSYLQRPSRPESQTLSSESYLMWKCETKKPERARHM